MNRLTAFVVAVAAAVAVPSLAQEPARVAEKGDVTRKGKTVMQYKDDDIQVVVGYRYANTHFDGPWIFVETFLSSTGGKPIEIAREDIQLVTPKGVIPLASQKRMAEGIPDLRRMLKEASISRDPLDGYFPGRPRQESTAFFTVPGEGIVYDRVTVDHRTLAGGDLFFESPTGKFAPGRYELQIRSKGVEAHVPFQLPADDKPLERMKDQNGKTIPW
ncbi:MAG: hypothetical protein ABIT01_15570 [Thermoanaerobaculia bacterium]